MEETGKPKPAGLFEQLTLVICMEWQISECSDIPEQVPLNLLRFGLGCKPVETQKPNIWQI